MYEDKFCVVTHRAVDIRVAWLVYLVYLGSHVLPAYSTYPLIRTYFFRFSLNGFLCKWCLVEF